MESEVGERFSEFFEKWVCQLDEYLKLLLRVSTESVVHDVCDQSELQTLASKVTQHYKDYFSVKWSLAHEDVLAINAFSWVTGWKPSTIFEIIDSVRKNRVPGLSLAGLTQEQLRKIEELRVKIRLQEEKVEREMERQQMAMADRKMLELARFTGRVQDSETMDRVDGLVEVALKGVMAGLEKVMKAADCVRLRTLKGVLDVLSPLQCVDFLAATSMLQIQLRKWGKKRDSISRKE
ncbi:unnamed protein product [Dovyalis caffra]|uniref:DOG1 domain-containing protein n=1 Tax=Dovyalis caffra TaxID=77055 RepID=A0AAV1SG18_9ROSI|nr:unnamed protein product [Dovyalis caffra]